MKSLCCDLRSLKSAPMMRHVPVFCSFNHIGIRKQNVLCPPPPPSAKVCLACFDVLGFIQGIICEEFTGPTWISPMKRHSKQVTNCVSFLKYIFIHAVVVTTAAQCWVFQRKGDLLPYLSVPQGGDRGKKDFTQPPASAWWPFEEVALMKAACLAADSRMANTMLFMWHKNLWEQLSYYSVCWHVCGFWRGGSETNAQQMILSVSIECGKEFSPSETMFQ